MAALCAEVRGAASCGLRGIATEEKPCLVLHNAIHADFVDVERPDESNKHSLRLASMRLIALLSKPCDDIQEFMILCMAAVRRF